MGWRERESGDKFGWLIENAAQLWRLIEARAAAFHGRMRWFVFNIAPDRKNAKVVKTLFFANFERRMEKEFPQVATA